MAPARLISVEEGVETRRRSWRTSRSTICDRWAIRLAMWADGRLLAFDVETTSVDVETARIVQAAQVYVGGGQPTDSTVLWINPGVPIPEEATAVHGITAGTLNLHGAMDAPAAMDELAHMIDLAISDSVPIVAYNARYDLTILDRELRRHGLVVPRWEDARVVDPHVIDKWLHRFRRGSRKLVDVCEHYGVSSTARTTRGRTRSPRRGWRTCWPSARTSRPAIRR
jgi:DNA polymerase III epsilon subunit-like protein